MSLEWRQKIKKVAAGVFDILLLRMAGEWIEMEDIIFINLSSWRRQEEKERNSEKERDNKVTLSKEVFLQDE